MKFRLLSVLLCTALATSTALAAGTGTDNPTDKISSMHRITTLDVSVSHADGFDGWQVAIKQDGNMFKVVDRPDMGFLSYRGYVYPTFSVYLGQSEADENNEANKYLKLSGQSDKLGDLQISRLGLTLGVGFAGAFYNGITAQYEAGLYVERIGTGCTKVKGQCTINDMTWEGLGNSLIKSDEYEKAVDAFNKFGKRSNVDVGVKFGFTLGYSFANVQEHSDGGLYLGLGLSGYVSFKDNVPTRATADFRIGYASYF